MAETVTESTKKSFHGKNNDPGFLVAKGRFSGENEQDKRDARKTHIKSLASAIFMAMSNHGYATIRAIGESASYNAIKSITIASGYLAPKGVELCWQSFFDEGNLGVCREPSHVETVTAMVFKLKSFKDWTEDRDKEGERNESSESNESNESNSNS